MWGQKSCDLALQLLPTRLYGGHAHNLEGSGQEQEATVSTSALLFLSTSKTAMLNDIAYSERLS